VKKNLRLFIGSAVERLPIAQAIQQELQYEFSVTIWNQRMFEAGDTTWTRLVEAAHREFDFALFVFGGEDFGRERDTEVMLTRDNVLLEYGLFVGALGAKRTFFLYDRTKKPKIASDLAGVTGLTFDGNEKNLQVAVGPACTSIRTRAGSFGSYHEIVSRGEKPLDELIDEQSKQVALIGPDLTNYLGIFEGDQIKFREQLKIVLLAGALERFYFVMMSPHVLKAVHPESWSRFRDVTIPAIKNIENELPGVLRAKLRICVHPAVTLSVLAVDWDSTPKKRLILMPKFQQTRRLDDQIVVSLSNELCEVDEIKWLIHDAERNKNGARSALITHATTMLSEELLK
jgi:hypothetical protein